MRVIDDDGRLFGLVNVVDAMVVLFVLSIAIAGAAIVTDDDDPEPDSPTRYATVAYEVPLGSEAAMLGSGGELVSRGGDTRYTVSDVYRSFSPNESVYVAARLAYAVPFAPDGQRLYGGDGVTLTTGSYRVDATVIAVNQTASEIPTATTPVVLEADVHWRVAEAIEPETTGAIAGERVARITAVEETGGAFDRRRVLIGAELITRDGSPVPAYDGESLRVGSPVTIVTDDVAITGRVVTVGSDDLREVEAS